MKPQGFLYAVCVCAGEICVSKCPDNDAVDRQFSRWESNGAITKTTRIFANNDEHAKHLARDLWKSGIARGMKTA